MERRQPMTTKVNVGIISAEPSNDALERILNAFCRHYAGVEYDLKLQLAEGSLAANWNRLMDRCEADFVCVLQGAIPIRSMWLYSLLDVMQRHPDCAIVMPIETQDGANPSPGFLPWLDKTATVGATYGFCNLIRKSAGLRADENLTYFVDIDLARQSIHNGFVNICNGHVWMQHENSKSPNASDIAECRKTKQADNDYLRKKWPQAKEG
jgi:ribosomal protein S24E